jgi:predicted amidophosphoribosyltransferase
MCTDSDIIQRSSFLERSILNKKLNINQMTSDPLNNLIFDIQINDILVKNKYCRTCHMIRPTRSSHSAICSNCISIFDHHCPFLSACIGMRNYQFFIFFLFNKFN